MWPESQKLKKLELRGFWDLTFACAFHTNIPASSATTRIFMRTDNARGARSTAVLVGCISPNPLRDLRGAPSAPRAWLEKLLQRSERRLVAFAAMAAVAHVQVLSADRAEPFAVRLADRADGDL